MNLKTWWQIIKLLPKLGKAEDVMTKWLEGYKTKIGLIGVVLSSIASFLDPTSEIAKLILAISAALTAYGLADKTNRILKSNGK